MTATMPQALVKPAKVGEMQCGDRAAVQTDAIIVLEYTKKTFIRSNARLCEAGQVDIWRDRAGYHVDVSRVEPRTWAQSPAWSLSLAKVHRARTVTRSPCRRTQ